MTRIDRFPRAAVSFILLVAALFFLNPSASADMDSGRFGQWMGIAMQASNIVAQSTLPVTAPIADFLVDPFSITENLIIQPINYAFPRLNLETPSQTLESYLQRSSIKVRGDTITIDGIDYQDIWVTNDAAQALRTNVLDLETAFNIASNSSGNFVSGVGYFSDNIPAFKVGNVIRSQNYSGFKENSYLGPFHAVLTPGDANHYGIHVSGLGDYGLTNNRWPWTVYIQYNGYSGGNFFFPTSGPASNYARFSPAPLPLTSAPFDFTFVSQTIPAEHLEPDDGIHLFVPNNPEQHSDPTVQQTIKNFNTDLSTNFHFDSPIDLGVGNNYSLFDSLFDIALGLNINPSFGPYDSYSPDPTPSPAPTEIPVPVPTPAPSEAPYDQIGTTPWSVLEEWLRSIREYLQTIVFYLRQILDEIKNLPQNISNVWDNETSGFGNWLKTILKQIGDGLTTGFQRLHDDFLLLFDDLKLFNIEFFKNVVDALEDSFEPLLDVLESVTSIWRYVVAWVGNISAPLSWSLSALGNAGSYFLSPFYAIAAGSIVIAIYRRFMR